MCRKWSSSYHPCDFPYTGVDCSETFAESAPDDSYSSALWLYRSWYLILLAVASIRIWYLLLDFNLLKGIGLQSRSPRRTNSYSSYDICNVLLFLMAFFLFVQSIDLYSWMDVMPYRFNVLMRQLCFAFCCTIATVIVVQWINLVYVCTHPLSRGKTRSRTSRLVFAFAQVVIWIPGVIFAFLALYVGVNAEGTYNGAWGCAESMVFCSTLVTLTVIALVFSVRLTTYLASDEETSLKPNPLQKEEESYAWGQARVVAKLVVCILIAAAASLIAGVNECYVNGVEVVYESPPCYYQSAFYWSHPSALLLPLILTMFLEVVPARRVNDAKKLSYLAKRVGDNVIRESERESESESRSSFQNVSSVPAAKTNKFMWLLFGPHTSAAEGTREQEKPGYEQTPEVPLDQAQQPGADVHLEKIDAFEI